MHEQSAAPAACHARILPLRASCIFCPSQQQGMELMLGDHSPPPFLPHSPHNVWGRRGRAATSLIHIEGERAMRSLLEHVDGPFGAADGDDARIVGAAPANRQAER